MNEKNKYDEAEREQIEEKTCETCLHYCACLINSEYHPERPCCVYKDKANYREQSEGEWIERADLQGFICSNGCGELLTELEEDATLPKFCPNCGTKMKNGTTIQEHVEILCKRLCRMKGGAE